MAFSLSGTTITQTGTDTDLTGLGSIAGVVVVNRNSHIDYYLNNINLIINGELTIAAEGTKEQLRFFETSPYARNSIVVNGTLNVGTFQANPLDYEYQEYIPAIHEDIGAVGYAVRNNFDGAGNNSNRRGSLYVNGGTLNCYARVVNVASYGANNGSSINIQRSFWRKSEGNYLYDQDVTIENSEIQSFSFVAAGNYTSLDGNIFLGSTVSMSNTTPLNTTYTVRGISDLNGKNLVGGGRSIDTDNSNSPIAEAINLEKGTDQLYAVLSGRYWRAELKSEVKVTAKDTSNNPIEGALVYYIGALGTEASGTTNENGEFDFTFLMATKRANAGTIESYVFYTQNQDTTDDLITLRAIAYNENISFNNAFSLRGVTVRQQEFFLIEDLSITESDKTIVDAYTELETAAKFYDRAKAYFIDNYAGESETIVTRSGNTIDARSYDVVIDATATNVFDFDGTTITIKASDFTHNIITTGTVSTANGAVISGVYEDVNGVVIKITSDENFTIKGTGITYTQDVNNITTQVAIGTTVEYACWQLGKKMLYVSQVINEPTTINLNFVREQFVDTDIDVSAQIADIDSSRVEGILTYEFGEMELTLDQAKAVTHRIFENEEALDFVLSNDVTGGVSINENNITIDAPIIHLERKDSLDITQEVSIRAYIDISGAVALNQSYALTPADVDGLRVIYYKDPIAIDYNEIKNAAANALTEHNASTSTEVAEARDEARIAANNTQV